MNKEIGDQLLETVKRNPEGLLFLAAGIALLMRQKSSRTDSSYYGDDEFAGRPSSGRRRQSGAGRTRSLSDATETARGYASEAADTVRDYASEAASSVSNTASRYANEAVRYSTRTQRKAAATTRRIVQRQPAAVAVAGLAAGVALAALLPKIEMEDQALSPVGQKLGETAQRATERFKEATQDAKDRLRSAIDEHGFNKDGLKEVASEVASAFGNAMTGESGSNQKPAQTRTNFNSQM